MKIPLHLKTRLIRIVCWVVIVWLGLWGGASWLVPKIVAHIIPKVEEKFKKVGIHLSDITYKKVKVSPWLNSVSLENVSVKFDLNTHDKESLASQFSCKKAEISLTNLFQFKGEVKVIDFDLKFDASDLPEGLPFDSFTDGSVRLSDLPFNSPRSIVKNMLYSLVSLFKTNQAVGDVHFAGNVQVRVGKETIPAKIYTERKDQLYRLRFSENDVRNIAEKLYLHLADDQVKMVSYFPLRVPIVVLLTKQAKDLSKKYFANDHWKEDALRHTAWSFLLTRAFGPEFAQVVTNAQESKPGNTHYERLMDYHNNAVGRLLAQKKIPLEQIPFLVEHDQLIIKSPKDAESRPAQSLLR